ncbi:hypothetical protein [Cognaticolwellia beringensis]|uniref:Solute-binding protein family 3/N-terminal domain-containing protein n=1 Tax=Cognaticolwellia beringensis TaxID=1967665 RepID=A0A222G5W3_9GAMM|nr:hypothetical protein [Cognaticolwellia beringensis]ASP46983.1 hypothetical protein B5D82_03840 [Cognaticolwellia beringensis]
MKKKNNLWLLNTLLISFVVLPLFGLNNLQAKEYVIGVEDVSYYPLYDFSIEGVDRDSFTKELLSTFFRHQGYKYKFVALPVKRFDKWYVEETIDFKFPDNERWRSGESKKLKLTFSQPVLYLIAGTFVLKKNKNKPREAIKRLGTIFGFFPTLWYDRVDNNTIELVENSSSYSLVKHLLYDNIDAVNIERNVIDYNLKLLNKAQDAVVLNKHIQHQRYAFHFSTILHPKIIQEFDQFLNDHSQQIADLKNKYGIVETSATF